MGPEWAYEELRSQLEALPDTPERVRILATLESLWDEVCDLQGQLDEIGKECDELEDKLESGGHDPDVQELAIAICEFANWQWGGYTQAWDTSARDVVARHLWSEVVEHVKPFESAPAGPFSQGSR